MQTDTQAKFNQAKVIQAKFNVASINRCSDVEGPFRRFTIWFQGCTLHCRGCANAAYQPLVPANIMTLEELMSAILDARAQYGIEGVTYSGGEPTLQQGLPALTQAIHDAGMGVISFTGRHYEDGDVKNILVGCDVVIDGEYDAAKPEKQRRLVGSANQRILYLTDRYKPYADWFADPGYASVEVNVGEDAIIANGDPF